MTNRIDVILPGLFQLPLAELEEDFLVAELPGLNHLLRFGRRNENDLHDFESLFADSIGLTIHGVLPFASGFTEGDDSDSQTMLIQATHLKADMRNAFVVPLDESDKTNKDINIIIKELSEVFKEDCDIKSLTDGLWLMHLRQCRVPTHYPHILSVIGRKVDPYIEQSREALPWYQLINEMQMFMHTHPVNQRRLLEGLIPINSLWCWGAGPFIPPENQEIQVYCDDPVLSAYAGRAKLRLMPLADLPKTEFSKENIYIDLSLLKLLKSAGDDDLQSRLSELELSLFKPLINAVETGQIHLRLRTGFDFDFELTRYSSYKIWRKSSNLMMLST